jgi:hypothetical protein
MRMRIILPKLWQSETFAGVSWDARFMLMGLWSYCDDAGRGPDKVALVAATLFPFDLQCDPSETFRRTTAALDELATAHLIWRYTVNGDEYLQIVCWDDWQQPVRPTPSRIPSGYRYCAECGAKLCDTGVTRPGARYCSSACRQRAYRNRDRNAPDESMSFSEAESVTAAVDETASQSNGYGKFMNPHEDSGEFTFELRTTNHELRTTNSDLRARGTRLPDDWQPPPRVIAQMRDKYPTVNQDDEFIENFRDYWRAKAGKDAQKRDWDAAYRYWIRNAAERNTNGHRKPPATGKSTVDQKVDGWLNMPVRGERKELP